MLTGVVVAGRVGAAIAAELGSMVVTEQIEALRSMGLQPARFLVVPRLLALLVMLPLLTVFADVVSILGGAWIAQTYAHISFDTFISSARQTIGFEDVIKGLLKAIVFAAIIVLVGAYQGLEHARRCGRRRQIDDGRGRLLDHPDLYLELRPLVLALRGKLMALIAALDNVSLAFGDKVVLKNCSLDIVEGAITCIVGLSGAGKSTILRLLDGLLQPTSGKVIVRDQNIAVFNEEQLIGVRQKISLAFQFAALLDSMTVGDNVALPLHEHTHLSESEIRKVVMDALDSVGLAHTFDNLPSELSGGMLKRAGFARAIVTRPNSSSTTSRRPDWIRSSRISSPTSS